MIGTWAAGLIRRRGGRLAATTAGIAVAAAVLATLGGFLTAAQASMTARAIRGVTVDWQVAGPANLLPTLRTTPGVRRAEPVGYATTSGLVATTPATVGETTQTTGPGQVLGLPPDYAKTFPGTLRVLAGTGHGVLVAQQAAANLHVAPGDTVLIGRAGLPPAPVVVTGIVDLPTADTLFQTVGAPPSTQPVAPPDNVVLLDTPLWHTVTDPLAVNRPDLVHTQVHIGLDHHLPTAPTDAYTVVTAAANHLEAATAGSVVVGDNLAAALDAARSDAAYARVLFLFLATPAAVLAALLTAAVTATGAARRRREQALLRARGATGPQLLRLAAVEAVLTGVLGAAAGLSAATLIGRLSFGTTVTAGWATAGATAGLVTAAVTVLAPAWRDTRLSTVAAGRAVLAGGRGPVWRRYFLDLVLLAAGGLVFWATSRTGYQLVLAPEGAPTISVSYWAFAAPALLWTGAALLAWRLRAVQPLQHRYAYVGTDLQDLYGVRPDTITHVTALRDTYFQGGTAPQLMNRLATHPDSILVSAETVHDFQLHPGDRLNLRLQNGRTKQLVTIPFHYAGVVTEFPTAPTDSFLVANADYITRHTGTDTVGTFLVDTGGTNQTQVAQAIHALLGTSTTVTDLTHTRATIGSSLTAVDLTGLSHVELSFALMLAAASGALVLGLGLAERRRSFAITAALGATRQQLRAFVTAETAVLTTGGLIAGALIGWLLSHVLVAVLTGVFDPPPTAPTIPWPYLATVTTTLLAALAAVTVATNRLAHRPPLRVLREL